MTKSAQDLFAQAMALPDADRVEFAERLMDTCRPSTDPDHRTAWESEIRDRIAATGSPAESSPSPGDRPSTRSAAVTTAMPDKPLVIHLFVPAPA